MPERIDTHRIAIGNAEHFPDSRGWFVGAFIDPAAGIRHAPVEVKWSDHPAGQERPGGIAPGADATTVTALVSGRFEVTFPGEHPDRVLLARPGDYAVFGPGVPHTWRALTDSTMFTVRWRTVGNTGR